MDKTKLINDHKRLIELEAFHHAKFIPAPVVLAEAYKIAHHAAETFDPVTGLRFSTHLTNQLKKLSRMSTKYGNTVRVPEGKQFKAHRLANLEKHLKDELGRDPNIQELSDASGLPMVEVSNLKKNSRKEVNASSLAYTPVFVEGGNDDWMHFVYHDLSPTDKLIFEHKTGFGGRKSITNEEISKTLGISASTVNNRVKMIADKISEGWNENL